MNESLENIIKAATDKLVNQMKAVTPKASGATADSIEAIITKDSLIIQADAQIGALINGRKPTSSSPKRGAKTVQQSILEWIKIMSIQPKESSMSQEALSWAISKSIHKNGYKGKGNFFKDLINDRTIADLTGLVVNQKLKELSEQLNKLD
jgi:hypothetical protein